MTITAKFIDGGRGKILITVHEPSAGAEHAIIVLPAFADEMNKSRRLVWSTAERLVKKGYLVVVPDLFGTGDSEGEFRDGCLQTWQEDVLATIRWLEQRGMAPDRLLGLRLGCLLAASTAQRFQLSFKQSIFWQPVLTGSAALTHILRTRVAASMMDESVKESVTELQARLIAGEAIEAAGYVIGTELAAQLKAANLSAASLTAMGRLGWIEISRSGDKPLGRASRQGIENAAKSDADIYTSQLPGEPFWSSVEIVRNRQLAEFTADELVSQL